MFKTLLEILRAKEGKQELQMECDEASRNIFINRLLLLKDKMTPDQMRDHVYTIASAGFETTGKQY